MSSWFEGIFLGRSRTGNKTLTSVSSDPHWTPLLQQDVPHWNDPPGVTWYQPLRGTHIEPSATGLIMIQETAEFYAELDLNEVNGQLYDQTSFRVQVDVTFLQPTDHSTFASLLVQTPRQSPGVPGKAGGYMFVLNPVGSWSLQRPQKPSFIPSLVSGFVTVDPHRPILLQVEVLGGLISCAIDHQVVITHRDRLNSGVIGLMVLRSRQRPSSPVRFTNFALFNYSQPIK